MIDDEIYGIIPIAKIDTLDNKHINISLTYVYGIGRPTADAICNKLGIPLQTKVTQLTEKQLEAIRTEVSSYSVEGDLRRVVSLNIKRLIDLGCYRGLRHRRGLPLRGQRTKTNARTRKGRRKSVTN